MSAWLVSDAELSELGQKVVANSAGMVGAVHVGFGELSIQTPAHRIVDVLTYLRDAPDLAFQQLIDLCGADYPQRERRFDIVYHLLSLTWNRRIRVKVETDEDTPVPSVTGVYPAADWFEREAFDLYGIFFEGHPDLRRILTDYGFHGHPMRKDFPMTGYVEVRYDDELKRVVYEPVKSVEFRNWDFLSPWEGADYARPGQGYPYELPGEDQK
ncbi:MAG TPA: NADH-quinone oxidoreductase subunit C [Caulobacteraceae bacterium]|nr:NADH-quinone oxidoreductase subunit C [Caulobacteraceae bacterium]